MKFSDLNSMDWDNLQSTEDWVKYLNDLRTLIDAANTADLRDQLADAFDAFADHSSAEDLSTITKLDASARKTARALRIENMSESIELLKTAADDYKSAVHAFDDATKSLKKEASLLRAEKFNAAVASLTDTVNSLKNLSAVTTHEDSKQLAEAITEAVESARKLREILESTR